MKARLLIFSPLPPASIGGLQSHGREFDEEMARRGARITIFAPEGVRYLHSTDSTVPDTLLFPAWQIIPNYPLPQFWRSSFWRAWRQFPHTPDTIVISRTRFFFSCLLAWYFSWRHQLPWVHIEHGSDFTFLHHGLWHALARWYDKTMGAVVLRHATRVVANSQASADFVRRLSGREDVEVIYRGIDMKVSGTFTTNTRVPDTLTVIYVGRLIHGKGVADLLRALPDNTQCIIIGDGPQRRHLEKIAGENVIFMGARSLPETMKLLSGGDIFVNPSYTEGLPTSVIEAALCGKAIIATNVGGTPEIVTHEHSALLIPPRDIGALTAALKRLIADPALRARLGAAARAQVEHRFNWQESGEKYERLFESMLAQNPSPLPSPLTPPPAGGGHALSLFKGRDFPQYLFRLDDICPTMNWENFERLRSIFLDHNIKPIFGIVPDNQDPKLAVNPARADFWQQMKQLADQGWIVAQHGYQHKYITKNAGILGLRARSEFASLPYEEQRRKIAAGKKILEEKLDQPITWWMAPAHSFDATTCRVLKDLGFTYIMDGIALYPFKKYDLTWVPHQIWKPEAKLFGLWTIGLHLNSLTLERMKNIEQFIKRNRAQFQFPNLTPRKSVLNIPFQWYWYAKFYALPWLYVRHRRKG